MLSDEETESIKIVIRYEMEQAEKAGKRMERQLAALQARFDPLSLATAKLTRDGKFLADQLAAGSINAAEHKKLMEALQQEYKQTEARVQGLARAKKAYGKAVTGAGSSLRAFRNGAQQAGFQIADVAVQVQGGTSAMVAFGQQGSQFLGIFGAYGAVAGAILAVGSAVGTSFLSQGKEAKKTGTAIERLTEATEGYVAAVEAADTPMSQLEAQYGSLAGAIREVLDLQEQAARAQAGRALTEAQGSIASAFGGFGLNTTTFEEVQDRSGPNVRSGQISRTVGATNRAARAEFAETLKKLRDDLSLTEEQAATLGGALQSFASAGVEEITEEVASLLRVIEQLPGGATAFEQKYQVLFREILSLAKDSAKLSVDSARQADQEIVRSYDERAQKLIQLEKDLEAAKRELKASSEDGNTELAQGASRAVRAIEDQIEETVDAEERTRALTEALAEMTAKADEFGVDEDGEVRKALQGIEDRLSEAAARAGDLDNVSLSVFEAEVRRVKGEVDGLNRTLASVYQQYGESRAIGRSIGRSNGTAAANELIRRREGFRPSTYLDVNHHRLGFGSDTLTAADGSVRAVREGDTVTRAEAQRDLDRRIQTYFDQIIRTLGPEMFSAFSASQQGVLASLLHNYGAGEFTATGDLRGVVGALRANDQQGASEEIARLGLHNDGINRDRRLEEAKIFGDPVNATEEIKAQTEAQRELTKAQKEAAKEAQNQADARQALIDQAAQLALSQEREAQLIGKSVGEQARLRAEWVLTDEAKRQGIVLTDRIAGSEQTYAERIRETAQAVGEYAQKADLAKISVDALKDAQDALEDASDRGAEAIANIFSGVISGSLSAKDAVLQLIAQIAQVQFLNGLKGLAGGGGFFGALGGLLTPNANGNAFSGGRPVPFAKGGVFDGPTLFPMAGGGTGLLGEAGPEAIMPLSRGADGKLGVKAARGSIGSTGSIHVTVGIDQAEGLNLMPAVRSVARDVSSSTSSQHLDAYDKGLPDRVQAIGAQPRRRR